MTIAVFDATFVSGIATNFTPVPLSQASFSGFEFSSPGRLVTTLETGGTIFLSAPNDSVAGAMTSAFQLGHAALSFTRAGSTSFRSYSITSGPPASVMEQFITCVQRMYGS